MTKEKQRKNIIDINGKETHVWTNPENISNNISRALPLPTITSSIIPKSVTIGKETYPVAPIGSSSGVRCSACLQPLTLEAAESSQSSFLDCENCGGDLEDGDYAELCIKEESLRHLDSDNVLADEWLHITFRKNWIEDLEQDYKLEGAPQFVHLGLESTIKSRLSQMQQEMTPDSWKALGEPIIYRVAIKPETAVHENISVDEGDHPKNSKSVKPTDDYVSDGVNRYINSYEDPGSISLMVPYTALEIIGTKIT